jgi:hypothetical protein
MKMKRPMELKVVGDPHGDLLQWVQIGKNPPLSPMGIKTVRLDKDDFMLIINGGARKILFNSKRHKRDLEKETKMFKILVALYPFRYKIKNDSVQRGRNLNPDEMPLASIAKVSGSKTVEAAYQHVKRLNEKFIEYGVPIKVKKKNDKCWLEISMS